MDDFNGLIQDAENGEDQDCTWALGVSSLNKAYNDFVASTKYELYEITSQGEIKESTSNWRAKRDLLSEE